MTAQALQTAEKLPFTPKGLKTHYLELRPEMDRQTRFQEVLHEQHWNARATTINALSDPEHSTHIRAAHRMSACGCGASFFIDPEKEKVRPWISRCGHRLCPFCSNARSASTAADLTTLMLEHHAERMIILTIRSHDLPLDMQIASMLHCFKKLRNRASWKKYITGGVYVVEITRNKETGLWHPHLHILVRGKYYPHAELSKQWREITHGSNIVWCQKVTNIDGAAKELAKYIGKPQRVAELDPAQIREYASATKNIRMVQTFGDIYGKKPQDTDKPEEAPRTDTRVRLSTLLHIARLGHNEAIVLLTWLSRRYKIFGRYVHHEAPQLIADPGGYDKAAEMLAIVRGEPPPRRDMQDAEYTEDELDHKICQAFICYQAQLALGTYSEIHYYHKTETERIDEQRWTK